ncbi:MAG: hypothetical protein QGF03_10260 [SAR324 cluster bacterium]|nr:hypothetical protein [SAR324 cluster bacterium]MDP7317528.1 hypothetical protein [SAR324 cluster bacterium]MDP7630935.1 hypothetical protein [SAR324 cluster bacterium]
MPSNSGVRSDGVVPAAQRPTQHLRPNPGLGPHPPRLQEPHPSAAQRRLEPIRNSDHCRTNTEGWDEIARATTGASVEMSSSHRARF